MRSLVVLVAIAGCESESPCERYMRATLEGGDPATNRCVEIAVDSDAAFDRIDVALSVDGTSQPPDSERLMSLQTRYDTTAISFYPIDPVLTIDAWRADQVLAHAMPSLVTQHGPDGDYYTVAISLGTP